MSNISLTEYLQFDSAQLSKSLKTDLNGLSSAEVRKRQEVYGKNALNNKRQNKAFSVFISQFKNPLILILLMATLISAFLGEHVSTVIIFVMIFLSAILGFVQEYRAEKIMETLKNKVALRARVIRDGKEKLVNTSELVPGDLVLLRVSSIVPADLRLVQTHDLAINQAILTGESFPVEKSSSPAKNICKQLLDAPNLALAGSHVVQGSGKGVVVAIGAETYLGKTAELLTDADTQSSFQKGIAAFGYFLFKIIIFFSLAVFLILALSKGNWLEALLFSLAIAVGISPELLPIIVTINLSRGARVMAKHKVIVKRLMAIENLGNADVLCTDKTGTLTEGKIELRDYFDFNDKKNEAILEFGRLCNTYAADDQASENPLDMAINIYAQKYKKKPSDYRIIESIPFDFYRRRMSVVVEKNKRRELVCKGAAAEILEICETILIDNKVEKIKNNLKKIKARIEDLESNGFRLILLAKKYVAEKDDYLVDDENGLTLLGALMFIDPPKKSAAATIRDFNDLGVKIKILTGDNDLSAKRLCHEIGYSYNRLALGEEIDKMSEVKLKKEVFLIDIFAKVTPEQKIRIVRALKESQHTVAFLGDGVNDAPALKAADVGISVSSAVDVAREAADVILLRKSLRVLIEGIKEGRRTFGNTLKYVLCTISSNFGNMFSVVGAAIFLPFIPMLPVQILLLNFLSDLPMLAISTDKVDEEYLKKPKQWDIEKIKHSMKYFGLLSSVFDYITFGFLILIINAPMAVFHAGWFWQSFLTEVLLIFVIRTKKWFWQSRPGKILTITSAVITLAVLLILFTNIREYFEFGILTWWPVLVIVMISLIYFFMVEFMKKYIYKKFEI